MFRPTKTHIIINREELELEIEKKEQIKSNKPLQQCLHHDRHWLSVHDHPSQLEMYFREYPQVLIASSKYQLLSESIEKFMNL